MQVNATQALSADNESIMSTRSSVRPRSQPGTWLLPKEHGAYGQLLFPLSFALVSTPLSPGVAALAASAVAGFLAHEPLVVWSGRRGSRMQRERGREARIQLCTWTVLAVSLAALGCRGAPDEARLAMLVVLGGIGLALTGILLGLERTWPVQLLLCVLFPALALPVALAGELEGASALSVWGAWSLGSLVATATVRSIARSRGRPPRLLARLVPPASLGLALALALSVSPHGAVVAAATPTLVACSWLVIGGGRPRQLRRVGWSLMASHALTWLWLGVVT